MRVCDPREASLPDVGLLVMEDAETGQQLTVDTHDQAFRARFEEAARQREYSLATALRRASVDAFSMSTEDDLVRAIVRMATRRTRRRKH